MHQTSSAGPGRDARRRARTQLPLWTEAGASAPCGGRLRDEGGWTLAELMVVTGLIVTLAGIAVPRYGVVATQMRTQAAAARILSDVNWTRVMSLRTGVPHYVRVTGAPAIVYEVRRSQNPPAIAPGTDPLLRSTDLSTKMPDVDFDLNGVMRDPYGGTASAGAPGQLVFDTRGLPTAPASFYVSSKDGVSAYAVSVTGAGQTRLWHRADGTWK